MRNVDSLKDWMKRRTHFQTSKEPALVGNKPEMAGCKDRLCPTVVTRH